MVPDVLLVQLDQGPVALAEVGETRLVEHGAAVREVHAAVGAGVGGGVARLLYRLLPALLPGVTPQAVERGIVGSGVTSGIGRKS